MLIQIKVSTGKHTIQRKERKEIRHAYVLVYRYKDINVIMWRCSCTFVQQGERVWDMNAFSFLVFPFCHNEETGNTSQGFFVYECVFVCVCARACGRHVATTPGEPS